MERNWRDFKSLHSNLPGARDAFETACETLFREIYSGENVQQVAVKQGDGGIDIFIGEIGITPITVIQCKFFLEEFGEVQQGQIRASFNTAKKSPEYELKKWILCIPIVLDIDQNKWLAKWKQKKITEFTLPDDFIQLINGNELIDLFKKHDLYNSTFKIEEALLAKDTNAKVSKIQSLLEAKSPGNIGGRAEKIVNVNDVLFNNYSKDKEKYYYERSVDREFNAKIKSGHVWVYGFSGAGKTALVNRNLIQNDIEYVPCDCSPITIFSVDDILNEIFSSISIKYNVALTTVSENKIKDICNLLVKCNFKKDVVVLIDEISFPNNRVEIDFATCVLQLVSYYAKSNHNHFLKFVISTIPKPLDILKDKSKASEHFQYMSANNWEETIKDFITKYVTLLKLQVNDEEIESIKLATGNSPRIAKNILRKLSRVDDLNSEKILLCINEAIKECV